MKKFHTTKDGRKMLISEMTDDHLINTILFLERRAKEGVDVYYGGGIFPEEMWFDYRTIYGEEVKKECGFKAYTEEAKKRGLKWT